MHTTTNVNTHGVGHHLATEFNHSAYGASLTRMTVGHNANLAVAISLARCHLFNLFLCLRLNGLGENLYVLHTLYFL